MEETTQLLKSSFILILTDTWSEEELVREKQIVNIQRYLEAHRRNKTLFEILLHTADRHTVMRKNL